MGAVVNSSDVRGDGRLAMVFPGQGSQRKGMGGELFDRYPEHCQQADAILDYSIKELCLEDPNNQLRDTTFAQPAIYVVNALSSYDLLTQNIRPDYYAGHSLGEYNALHAAGCMDFATGLELVAQRGKLMGQANGGGMMAIIGMSDDHIARLFSQLRITQVDIANINTSQQIVISGDKAELGLVSKHIGSTKQGRCVPLQVSAAFHSRFMQQAARQFKSFLQHFSFQQPHTPVIANVTAAPLNSAELPDLLAQQICSPVNWLTSMHYLLAQGVDEIVETAGSQILTKMWKDIKPEWKPIPSREAKNTKPAEHPTDHPKSALVGSPEFKKYFGLTYACVSGAMFRGIGSTDIVIRMAKAGMLGFFGAGGLSERGIQESITEIKRNVRLGQRWGMNLLHAPVDESHEINAVKRFLEAGVNIVEAAGFISITSAVVQYRYSGAKNTAKGVAIPNSVFAKISRLELAQAFANPPSEKILQRLLAEGRLSQDEVSIARNNPIADVITVEADSGGHTDAGNLSVLLPAIKTECHRIAKERGYVNSIFVGAAGGMGTPESVAAAFMLGADFVVTGSINQCSVEAGTSDIVKQMLAGATVQDTAYAPAGDMFELGAKVQVLSKGTLFAARGNKLYQLYRQYASLEEIDEPTRRSIEDKYFRKSFDQVWKETCEYFLKAGKASEVERAEKNPKHKMALVFRWYFAHSIQLSLSGAEGQAANYQVHCGPAMGAFNNFVKGTALESWKKRHVDNLALVLLDGAYEVLDQMATKFKAVGSKEIYVATENV